MENKLVKINDVELGIKEYKKRKSSNCLGYWKGS